MMSTWTDPVIDVTCDDDVDFSPFDDGTWKRTLLFCVLVVAIYLGGVYLSTRGHANPEESVQGSASLTTPAASPRSSVTISPGGSIRVPSKGSPSTVQPVYLCGGALVLNPGTWIENVGSGDILIVCHEK